MENNVVVFKTKQFNGMTTVEIAQQTGKEHRNVKRDTETMLTELYGKDSLLKFEQSYTADNGQTYSCYQLGKNDVLTLISGYSIPLRSKIIKRLDELENNNNGYINISEKKKEIVEIQLMTTKYLSEMLNYSEISTLKIVHNINNINGIPTDYLPKYIEHQRVHFSLSRLFEINKITMTARKFNALLEEQGYIETKKRKSTKAPSGYKNFKVIIDKGLQYGLNISVPESQNETQPHYYEDTFLDFFNMVCNYNSKKTGTDNMFN